MVHTTQFFSYFACSSDRHSIVSHLLDSMRFALDETPTAVERTTVHSPKNTSEFLSGASTKKLQTASVFLHIIAEIARQTPTVVDMLASGKENRENLQFWVSSADSYSILIILWSRKSKFQ
ncbi:unnamed protein product [Trichobilharzia regenti]|nr:unnamed protein product [Trichobilharzia regenti]